MPPDPTALHSQDEVLVVSAPSLVSGEANLTGSDEIDPTVGCQKQFEAQFKESLGEPSFYLIRPLLHQDSSMGLVSSVLQTLMIEQGWCCPQDHNEEQKALESAIYFSNVTNGWSDNQQTRVDITRIVKVKRLASMADIYPDDLQEIKKEPFITIRGQYRYVKSSNGASLESQSLIIENMHPSCPAALKDAVTNETLEKKRQDLEAKSQPSDNTVTTSDSVDNDFPRLGGLGQLFVGQPPAPTRRVSTPNKCLAGSLAVCATAEAASFAVPVVGVAHVPHIAIVVAAAVGLTGWGAVAACAVVALMCVAVVVKKTWQWQRPSIFQSTPKRIEVDKQADIFRV